LASRSEAPPGGLTASFGSSIGVSALSWLAASGTVVSVVAPWVWVAFGVGVDALATPEQSFLPGESFPTLAFAGILHGAPGSTLSAKNRSGSISAESRWNPALLSAVLVERAEGLAACFETDDAWLMLANISVSRLNGPPKMDNSNRCVGTSRFSRSEGKNEFQEISLDPFSTKPDRMHYSTLNCCICQIARITAKRRILFTTFSRSKE
jgi:hypothetical protein